MRKVFMRLALAAIASAMIPSEISRAQSGDQSISFDFLRGRQTAALRMPAAARPPLAVLISVTHAEEVATALAGAGIASVRIDTADEELAGHWIAFLRNDERFPTITIVGQGAGLGPAVIAARAARADGVIARGAPGNAEPEFARVIAAKTSFAAGTPASDASGIADFVRKVPALGRRGTSASRPASARRSLRHVMMATIGTVRVGIEWGAPEKRGREVWGALVPWSQEWMPGADEATTLTTNGPIRIGTVEIPAGDHTFFALPAADRFELIVSNDVGQFHTQHNASLHLGRTDMSLTMRQEAVEALTFAMDVKGSTAVLKLTWDNREYAVPVQAIQK